jgi:hypothetical protein
MKLCGLLHETTGKCPTCGGKVNSQGVDPTSIIFPDKHGKWVDPDSKEVLHTSDEANKTKRFQKVLKPESEKRPGNFMQGLLAYRKELADQKRAAQQR